MEKGKMESYAHRAYQDLLRNYWTGDEETGQIINTWTGIPIEEVPEADYRGGLWERGMMLIAMDNYYAAIGDESVKRRIVHEAKRVRALYTPEELSAAGTFLHNACDDCGWHARLYLLLYRYEPDPWFLDCAKLMMDKCTAIWMDDKLGGGMWYENTRTWKSLYQIAIVLCCLDIYEYTHEEKYFIIAMECYYWMEAHLRWKAGIYWTDLNYTGMPGQQEPRNVVEGIDQVGDPGSLSFLGGNMAMGAIHARLYRLTGLEVFRQRLDHLCDGLAEIYVRHGCFINDRDAWTDTYCLGEWTRDAATLPNFDPRMLRAMFTTARSVAENARTEDGHYSAVWRGPAEDPNHRWVQLGSIARQITTSSTGANWIMCAFLLQRLTGIDGDSLADPVSE